MQLATGSAYSSPAPEDQFWSWFYDNEPTIFECEKDFKRVLSAVAAKLQEIDQNLTFCIGDVQAGGVREFIISAGGIKRSFLTVQKLVTAACPLPRWKIVAFSPRSAVRAVEVDGISLEPSQVWFANAPHHTYIGLTLYIEGYSQSHRKALLSMASLMLYSAVGEYDAAMKIGYIDAERLPIEPERLGLLPLARLPEIVDGFSSPIMN